MVSPDCIAIQSNKLIKFQHIVRHTGCLVDANVVVSQFNPKYEVQESDKIESDIGLPLTNLRMMQLSFNNGKNRQLAIYPTPESRMNDIVGAFGLRDLTQVFFLSKDLLLLNLRCESKSIGNYLYMEKNYWSIMD